MSDPRFMPKYFSRDRLVAGRKKHNVSATFKLETLEGRALLSHMVSHPAKALAVELQRQPEPHPGPILNEIGPGYAVKSLRIYPYYSGAKRPELNGASARAFFDGKSNFVVTANVGGPIKTTPTDASQEEYYTWAFNLGNATAPGPFPGRPNITFDTTLTLAITKAGTTLTATNVNTGQTLALPTSLAVVSSSQDNIRVTLPESLATNSGLLPPALTQTPKFVFWAANAPASAGPSAIESFVPEGRSIPIALSPHIAPLFGRHR